MKHRPFFFYWLGTILLVSASSFIHAAENLRPTNSQWQHYGADLSGSRYAPDVDINQSNVNRLTQSWVYRTGDWTAGNDFFGRKSTFKATPIYFEEKLIFTSGFNRVFAVDPESGVELWVFDPKVDFDIEYAEMFSSRGVSSWVNSSPNQSGCQTRVFLGTIDARLIAIDAQDGTRCVSFGDNGQVDLSKGILNYRRGEYSVTTPPLVVNDVVIVGSSVGDNGATNIDSGIVRAFHAESGNLLWEWDPIPKQSDRPETDSWENESWRNTGGANVWSSMAADSQRNLVYLPTTSPSPDFYGGMRLGDNAWSNSIVALDINTGEMKWAFQTVRHDLWDYDIAAQPLLADIEIDSTSIPAVVQATKTGFVYFLNRETGAQLFPIEERLVPPSDVPGERAAKSQPFPPLRLHPQTQVLPNIFSYSAEHKEFCERLIDGARYEGIFTPPSLEGTILYPGNPGGANWGSMASLKTQSTAFVVINRWPTLVQLLPRSQFNSLRSSGVFKGTSAQFTEQAGTPFGMVRFDLFKSYPQGSVPCLEGPWSTLVAIDLEKGQKIWEVPIGIAPAVSGDPVASTWGGLVNYGGPIVTKGGVIFQPSRVDRHLYAFNAENGEKLWQHLLPAEPHATPMSFLHKDAMYVVIAAGGKSASSEASDYLVAFKLDKQ